MASKLIDTRCFRRPFADTEDYEIYESDCETIGQFVEEMGFKYPNNDHAWYESYIEDITKEGNKFTVKRIIPFTD